MSRSGRNKRNDNRPKATAEDIIKYQDAWSRMMVTIWRDKIDRLNIFDTGQLRHSLMDSMSVNGDLTTITHTFIRYGIYQDRGTGREIPKDNGGNVMARNELYRIEHGLDEPRKRGPRWGGGYTSGEPRKERPWLDKSYYISNLVLRDQMVHMYGEEFCSMIVRALSPSDY